jgi:hypothetical protein
MKTTSQPAARPQPQHTTQHPLNGNGTLKLQLLKLQLLVSRKLSLAKKGAYTNFNLTRNKRGMRTGQLIGKMNEPNDESMLQARMLVPDIVHRWAAGRNVAL